MTSTRDKITAAAEASSFQRAATLSPDDTDYFVHLDGRQLYITWRMTKGVRNSRIMTALLNNKILSPPEDKGVVQSVLDFVKPTPALVHEYSKGYHAAMVEILQKVSEEGWASALDHMKTATSTKGN